MQIQALHYIYCSVLLGVPILFGIHYYITFVPSTGPSQSIEEKFLSQLSALNQSTDNPNHPLDESIEPKGPVAGIDYGTVMTILETNHINTPLPQIDNWYCDLTDNTQNPTPCIIEKLSITIPDKNLNKTETLSDEDKEGNTSPQLYKVTVANEAWNFLKQPSLHLDYQPHIHIFNKLGSIGLYKKAASFTKIVALNNDSTPAQSKYLFVKLNKIITTPKPWSIEDASNNNISISNPHLMCGLSKPYNINTYKSCHMFDFFNVASLKNVNHLNYWNIVDRINSVTEGNWYLLRLQEGRFDEYFPTLNVTKNLYIYNTKKNQSNTLDNSDFEVLEFNDFKHVFPQANKNRYSCIILE